MAGHHRRSSSIPTIRLSQPLPPLPITLDDIRPRNVSQITIIPYHDDPAQDSYQSPKSPDNQPPSYEPMYDYLRSQQRPIRLIPPHPQSIRIMDASQESEEPYRDDPFVITIDHDLSQPPPPSYEELYIGDQNTRELQRRLGEVDGDGSAAEEICKFIVAMLIIALTIGLVGTAFHWGR